MSFLCKPPYDRPAFTINAVPAELSPAEVRRVHVLHLRRDSLQKQIAFIDGQILSILKTFES